MMNRREFLKLCSTFGAGLALDIGLLDVGISVNSFAAEKKSGEEKKSKEALIAFGGDTLLGGYYNSRKYGTTRKLTQIIERFGTKASAEYFFGEISQIIEGADLAVVNLEGPIIPKMPLDEIKKKLYPKAIPLLQHEDAAKILKLAGVDLVSLANNHLFDYNGTEGLERTIAALNESGLNYIGAGIGDEAYGYKVKNVNGINIAFLAVSDIVEPKHMVASASSGRLGIAGIPERGNYRRSPYLRKTIQQIKEAKRHSDYCIIIVHAGPIGGHSLNRQQVEIANILLEENVDVIVGSHSHAKQPIKEMRDGQGKLTQIVFYGLGNLVFGGRRGRQKCSMIAAVHFSLNCEGEKSISYDVHDILPNPKGTFRPTIMYKCL
jgi:poly-gamma-glutamate capsule biosynthesis protein CapA/YwtB (metallophosphatase superfamily)